MRAKRMRIIRGFEQVDPTLRVDSMPTDVTFLALSGSPTNTHRLVRSILQLFYFPISRPRAQMTAVHVLDDYYLAITALMTVGYQLLGFAVAWTFKFDKVTDLTGGAYIPELCVRLTERCYVLQAATSSCSVRMSTIIEPAQSCSNTIPRTALFTLLAGDRTSDTRSLVISIFVMVWATRIAGFLFLRVLVTGSDNRFDSIRSHFWSFFGKCMHPHERMCRADAGCAMLQASGLVCLLGMWHSVSCG